MHLLKVSGGPWCVNELDIFGVLVRKMSNLWKVVLWKKIQAWNWNYSWLAFPPVSFCHFQALSLQPSFYQVTREQCSHCLFLCLRLCVPMWILPTLIQPWASSVPCRLNVSSLTLMSSYNLFACLCGLPRCPHNVRQSIIMWPTYLPRLPTPLVIHPLACTVPISDLPLPPKKTLSFLSFPLLPIMPV